MDTSMVNEDILMLFEKMPDALPLYLEIEKLIYELFPEVKRKVGKTQVGFSGRYGFAFVWPPIRRVKWRSDTYVVLTFGLGHQVRHPRIAESVEPYPGRWTHHVTIGSPQELDDQIVEWLRQAWDFSMSK